MLIRKALASDADTVHRFICELEEQEMDRTLFDKYYLQAIDSKRDHYLVAEEAGRVIGFISCQGQLLLHHLGWVYEIQEMVVDAAYRGKGVGKVLLEALESILDKTEYDILEVSSNNRRKSAHVFYLQNGFKQSHQKFTKKPC